MKKKLIMSLAVLLTFGLLVGCGNDKKNNENLQTNEGNTNVNENNTNNNEENKVKDYTGAYIAEDTYDAEGVILIKNGDGYIVMIRDSSSTMVDEVSEDEIKNNRISSTLRREEYTIDFKDNGIVYNFPIYLVENKDMRRSKGKLDGVYEDDTRYFIMFTLKKGEIRCYTYHKQTGNFYVEKIKSFSFTDQKGYAKGYLYGVSYDFKKSGDKLIVTVDTDEADWEDASGEYTKIG